MIIGTMVESAERPREIGAVVGRDYSSTCVWVRWTDGRITMEDPEDLKTVQDVSIDNI